MLIPIFRLSALFSVFLVNAHTNTKQCEKSLTKLSANCAVDGNCLCSRLLNEEIKRKLHIGGEMLKKQKRNMQLMEDEVITNLGKIIQKPLSPKCLKYYPLSCYEIFLNEQKKTGAYMIYPTIALKPFYVYCDFDEYPFDYLTVFKRFDGSQNFDLEWNYYKNGFGDFNGEFWLGLQRLYEITNDEPNEAVIKVFLRTNNSISTSTVVPFTYFSVGSESEGYYLKTPQDSQFYVKLYNGTKFSTKDRRIENCKKIGGWWFNCTYNKFNLMGTFYDNETIDDTTMYIITKEGKKEMPLDVTMLIRTVTPFSSSIVSYDEKSKFVKQI